MAFSEFIYFPKIPSYGRLSGDVQNYLHPKLPFFTLFRGKLQIFGHWSLQISSIPILVRNYGQFAIQQKEEDGSRPKNEHVRIFHTEFTKV